MIHFEELTNYIHSMIRAEQTRPRRGSLTEYQRGYIAGLLTVATAYGLERDLLYLLKKGQSNEHLTNQTILEE